ncbi:MAG: BspA type Leucine rich repeat region (6 copies), partial [Firmicutes bacterium]|nr:BspA type Leucine rich repeat region (6 copies) [Bacillota bacterium]
MILRMENGRAVSYSGWQIPDAHVEIPEGTTEIGSLAFFKMREETRADIPQFRTITIPGSVQSIAAKAFYRCENLEAVD